MNNIAYSKQTSKIINTKQSIFTIFNLEKIIPGAKIVDNIEINKTPSSRDTTFILSNDIENIRTSRSNIIKTQNKIIKHNIERDRTNGMPSRKFIMNDIHKTTSEIDDRYYQMRDLVLDQLKHDIIQKNIIQYLKEYQMSQC